MKIFIPARGGSKRILRKNIIDLNGKPLIAHVIECALEITSEVYVSTDYYDIADIARSFGAKTLIRPGFLATDYTTANEVVAHFLEQVESANQFAYVQPTSPLLTSPFLKKGMVLIFESSVAIGTTKQIADKIDDVRVKAGLHYPSDGIYAKKLVLKN